MAKVKAKTRNLADYSAEYDPAVIVPNKIRTALAALAKEGPEAWEPHMEFLTRAGLNTIQANAHVEEFESHTVHIRANGKTKIIWFGDPKVAKKARGG